MKLKKPFLFLCFCLLLISCGSEKPKFVKSPLDTIITKYIDKSNYSVILSDMDYKEDTDSYFHKYQILIDEGRPNLSALELNDTTTIATDIKIIKTDWQKVSPITFDEYKGDLGMTVLSKKNGVLDKNSSPAGVDNYVGNSKYGQWQTNSSGGSFWSFYGRYRLMSDLFYGPRYAYGYGGYSRSHYNDYNRNYRNKQSYYGANKEYGTKSTKNTSSSWSKKPSSFKNNVNSKVTKSASSLRSRGYSSSKSYSKSNNRTRRSGSRYSNRSSRSRSGGFGK
jgi:hypothetical protein